MEAKNVGDLPTMKKAQLRRRGGTTAVSYDF